MTRHSRIVIAIIIAVLVISYLVIRFGRPSLNALTNPAIPAVQAKSANSFIQSIGINVHAYWWTPAQSAAYLNDLKDLHIHYIRDELVYPYASYQQNNGYGSGWLERLQQFQQASISSEVIANELIVSPTDVVNYVKQANQVPGTISAVEGPNEVDFQCAPTGSTFTGQIFYPCPTTTWQARTENYVMALKNAMKADSATRAVAITSPSIIDLNTNSAVFAGQADSGNIHYYPYLQAANTTTISQQLNQAVHLYSAKPIIVSEEGYPTSVGSAGRPASETIQAEVLPAYLLTNYATGVKRTFLYQLVDDSNFSDFNGLISDTSGQKKPAFTALKNLTALLNDDGANFSPNQLRYQLSGATDGISSLLLQKSDGRFYLVLWQKSLAESPTPLPGQTVNIKTIGIQFGDSIDSASEFQPTTAAASVQNFSQPTELGTISVGSSPVVLEITPGAASASSTNSGNGSPASTAKKTVKTPIIKKPITNSTGSSVTTPPTAAPAQPPASPDFVLPGAKNQPIQSWWENISGFFSRSWQWLKHLFTA
ncbi:MAG TPA: hypothetical protein VLE93_01195 [Candidatus Saccharimonadales bacterium]|nr:hypothetical protein [Candidatus Saccharimonadales bacterium]